MTQISLFIVQNNKNTFCTTILSAENKLDANRKLSLDKVVTYKYQPMYIQGEMHNS